jgi:hypothetical protein
MPALSTILPLALTLATLSAASPIALPMHPVKIDKCDTPLCIEFARYRNCDYQRPDVCLPFLGSLHFVCLFCFTDRD